MEELRNILSKHRSSHERRKKAMGDVGSKLYRRKDIEKVREREYLEREEMRRKAKRKRTSTSDSSPTRKRNRNENDVDTHLETKTQGNSSNPSADSYNIQSLPKSEVFRRLRSFGLPVTFFGETDLDRLKRMRQAEAVRLASGIGDTDLALQGSHAVRNVFLDNESDKTSTSLSKQKESKDKHKNDAKADVPLTSEGEIRPGGELQHFSKQMKLYKFFRRMLNEWAGELDKRSLQVKQSISGKVASKTQSQCKDYMRHFFKLCKANALPAAIEEKITKIVELCQERQYRKAGEVYMDLSIGRAAWPIGATAVGIHARAGRERIGESKIAHVMQDEACRKYITSIKRLMTFCQTKYPTSPSRKMLQ